MSQRNDPKKDAKKPPEEEEWKKKRRYSDDPIVKKYTHTTYHSFKSYDEYKKKTDDEEYKKKKYELDSDKRPGFQYDHASSFKEKPIESDDYKKSKKDMGNILDEMFHKKEDKPFGAVQYDDHAKHIQQGEEGKHRRRSSDYQKDHKKVKEHKIIQRDDDRKRDEDAKKVMLDEEARKKKKDGEYYGAKTGDMSYAGFDKNHRPGEMPGFEKKKKRFDEEELKKSKEEPKTAKAPSTPRSDEDKDTKKKRKFSLGKTGSKPLAAAIGERNEDLEAKQRKEAEDELEAKREKAKKEKKLKLAAELAAESRSRTSDTSTFATASSATFSMGARGASDDYEKKKKKRSLEYSGLAGSAGAMQAVGKKRSEEKYERKRKKSYDYEELFKKDQPATDDKLKQAYALSQPYRSVSTSGSRTSLEGDQALTSSLSIASPSSSKVSGSETGSKLAIKSKEKKTSPESKSKMKKEKSLAQKGKDQDMYSQDVFMRLKIRREDAPIRVQNYLKQKHTYPTGYIKRTIKYFILKDGEKIDSWEYEILGKCMENELMKGGAITSPDHFFLESMNIAFDEPAIKKRVVRFDIEIRMFYSEKAPPVELEKSIKLYFDSKIDKLTSSELARLHKIMKDELASKREKTPIHIKAPSKEAKSVKAPSKEAKSVKAPSKEAKSVKAPSKEAKSVKAPSKVKVAKDAGKDIYLRDVFVKLKIRKEDAPTRVREYAQTKHTYPTNYYKRTNKYFNIKDSEKIDNPQYEILGKCMEAELLKGGEIINSDNNDFLDSLGIPFDNMSKKKRLIRFETEHKSTYPENPTQIEMEKLVRLHFDLKNEKLTPFEINHLHKIMKEELLPQKYSFDTDVISKEKRIKDHKNIVDKVCDKTKSENLDENDVASYFNISAGAKSSTQHDLDMLIDVLTSEVVEVKLPEFQEVFSQGNQIPTDDSAKKERYNLFKTDLLVSYDVDNLKYFIGKYFNKDPEKISDRDVPTLFRILQIEVEREMVHEPKNNQEELQRVINLMGNEVKIAKEQKDDISGDTVRQLAIQRDQQALAERLKRFKDIILPDYKSNAKKFDYKDRIAAYFNINLDNYSPNEIEALGHMMDVELKENGVNFVCADDQFLQDKHVDPNEAKRTERARRYSVTGEKEKELFKNLETKQLVGKYYDIDTNDLNDEDLIHFSNFMVDELLNEEGEKPVPEIAIQALKNKGIEISPVKRQQRRLKFKNEMEPELKKHIKELDYVSTVAKYFDLADAHSLNMQEIARLKRLMDRELRQLNKVELADRYKISFDENATINRLKKFKDTIEPDYQKNLKKLTYQTRIAIYFGLDVKQLKKEDLEKLGKLMEDELVQHRFPTDDDFYLLQMNIPITPTDKKKRVLRLRNELERNPVKCNNPFYLLKIYFDIKDMDKLNDEDMRRLTKIMEEEQLTLNGDLIANLLKNKTEQEKLMALMNLLQLRDFDKLKNSNYTIYMRVEEQSGDGKTTVKEYSFKIKRSKDLNEEVLRLERENAAKINELREALELKVKASKTQEDITIDNLKQELEREVKNQNELKVGIAKSGIDRDEQQKLLEKLAEQQRNLEEQKNARIREEAEKLRKETEEKYKKQLASLEDEERQKEMKEIEELEKRKAELIQKHRQEHQERKKRLQEEAEKANQENEKKLKAHAKEFEENIKKQMDQSKKKLDEEYKSIKLANKEVAQKYKKEFDNEKEKIEIHLSVIEKRIRELRKADEEERRSRLKAKAKELEDLNTKKLKEEVARLEAEARERIKEITVKLEEEMNRPENVGKANIVEETNQKRLKIVNELNEKNRKKLEQIESDLEREAMIVLDTLARELETEAKKRIDKQIEQDRKDHEQQIAKLREALAKMKG